ncbi:MAG TPA: hypothetical protein VK572_12260 [Burkholderiales bacterium]|nr:hypothetical protein [Burkholderiales bacterium]
MIRNPTSRPPGGIRKPRGNRAWIWACALLLAIAWVPLFGIHFYRMSLDRPATGTVLVVFPPTVSMRDFFRSVAAADGSLVGPVDWFPRMWVVQSAEPGFVGRLKEHGAWGVYSTDLLSTRALFSCSGIVAPPSAAGPAVPSRPAS